LRSEVDFGRSDLESWVDGCSVQVCGDR
jgi:hypothetical protein